MVFDENTRIKNLIEEIRELNKRTSYRKTHTVIGLCQTVLHDTVGASHPLIKVLDHALESGDTTDAFAASRSVVKVFDAGGLISPRLAIAHEIEGDILDIAQEQVEASETNQDANHKQLQLGIAAFLAGAALEDALRRLCDSNGISYNPQRTSISSLQIELYQPTNQIEVISQSETKQITAWGDVRNKADHGRFSEITHSEVLSMVIGVQGFILMSIFCRIRFYTRRNI